MPGACVSCGGAGQLLRLDKAGNVWTASGMARLVPCPKCNGEDKRQMQLQRICGLSGAELDARFDGYWTKKHGTRALDAARRVLAGGNGWLTLAGDYGSGKTFLLQAIVNEARLQGMAAVYVQLTALLDHLRDAFRPNAEVSFDALWDAVCRSKVLCLDEIEKYNATPWAEERLFGLMNERYRNWQTTVTVLATNGLEDCHGYLKSRMLDGRFTVVQISGGDIRPGLRRDEEVLHA